jgi:hypothetical protein
MEERFDSYRPPVQLKIIGKATFCANSWAGSLKKSYHTHLSDVGSNKLCLPWMVPDGRRHTAVLNRHYAKPTVKECQRPAQVRKAMTALTLWVSPRRKILGDGKAK